MDEFEKNISQSNKKKGVREQILFVHIVLGFEEAHHPWSRDRYDYSNIEIIEHIVKVFIFLIKKKNLPKEAPMEHPRLSDFSTVGTFTGDIDKYYSEQAKNDKHLRF